MPALSGRTSALLTVALLLCSGVAARAQRGARTAAASLDQLVQQAGTIVRGYVVSAAAERHPQFPGLRTVVVTLRVERVLKGSAAERHTFRQYVWDGRDAAEGLGYRKAQELLLFLNPESVYGLTSPVGLEQGRFRIERQPDGTALAVNGRGNAGLFRQVTQAAESHGVVLSPRARAMLAAPPEQATLEALEEAVAALAGGPR